MRRATIHHPVDTGATLSVSASVTLEYDDRHRRRIRLIDDAGEAFMLDLDKATYLSDGDLLELEDGSAVLVKAAIEDVLEVTCDSAEQTARIAWHVGNRHMPVQVLPGGVIRLRYDHVLEAMIMGLGGTCEKKQAPFAPEPGAYSKTGQTQGESGGHHAHH